MLFIVKIMVFLMRHGPTNWVRKQAAFWLLARAGWGNKWA